MDSKNEVSLDFKELNDKNSETISNIHYSKVEFADEDDKSLLHLIVKLE